VSVALIIQAAKCMRRIVLSSVVWFYTFFHISSLTARFSEKKRCYWTCSVYFEFL